MSERMFHFEGREVPYFYSLKHDAYKRELRVSVALIQSFLSGQIKKCENDGDHVSDFFDFKYDAKADTRIALGQWINFENSLEYLYHSVDNFNKLLIVVPCNFSEEINKAMDAIYFDDDSLQKWFIKKSGIERDVKNGRYLWEVGDYSYRAECPYGRAFGISTGFLLLTRGFDFGNIVVKSDKPKKIIGSKKPIPRCCP